LKCPAVYNLSLYKLVSATLATGSPFGTPDKYVIYTFGRTIGSLTTGAVTSSLYIIAHIHIAHPKEAPDVAPTHTGKD
jgi:hypothetical protein